MRDRSFRRFRRLTARPEVLSAVIGAIVGGALAIIGGLVGSVANYQAERGLRQDERDAQARGVARILSVELVSRADQITVQFLEIDTRRLLRGTPGQVRGEADRLERRAVQDVPREPLQTRSPSGRLYYDLSKCTEETVRGTPTAPRSLGGARLEPLPLSLSDWRVLATALRSDARYVVSQGRFSWERTLRNYKDMKAFEGCAYWEEKTNTLTSLLDSVAALAALSH